MLKKKRSLFQNFWKGGGGVNIEMVLIVHSLIVQSFFVQAGLLTFPPVFKVLCVADARGGVDWGTGGLGEGARGRPLPSRKAPGAAHRVFVNSAAASGHCHVYEELSLRHRGGGWGRMSVNEPEIIVCSCSRSHAKRPIPARRPFPPGALLPPDGRYGNMSLRPSSLNAIFLTVRAGW